MMRIMLTAESIQLLGTVERAPILDAIEIFLASDAYRPFAAKIEVPVHECVHDHQLPATAQTDRLATEEIKQPKAVARRR